jgi:hypothetical protein
MFDFNLRGTCINKTSEAWLWLSKERGRRIRRTGTIISWTREKKVRMMSLRVRVSPMLQFFDIELLFWSVLITMTGCFHRAEERFVCNPCSTFWTASYLMLMAVLMVCCILNTTLWKWTWRSILTTTRMNLVFVWDVECAGTGSAKATRYFEINATPWH